MGIRHNETDLTRHGGAEAAMAAIPSKLPNNLLHFDMYVQNSSVQSHHPSACRRRNNTYQYLHNFKPSFASPGRSSIFYSAPKYNWDLKRNYGVLFYLIAPARIFKTPINQPQCSDSQSVCATAIRPWKLRLDKLNSNKLTLIHCP